MKTTSFYLDNPKYEIESGESVFQTCSAQFTIPTLPAYAISRNYLSGINIDPENGYNFSSSEIIEDKVIIHGMNEMHQYLFTGPIVLTINYIGIRDYKYFFPQVENEGIKERVACFMEEADKNFDESSWLSFAMMAGAVIEGILADMLKDVDSTFGSMVNKIKKLPIFKEDELNVLEFLVGARNLIHAGRYNESYITRDKAMSVRLHLDEMIKSDWEMIKEEFSKI